MICRTALDLGPVVAIDTETLGLNPQRDRLCLVQLSAGDDTPATWCSSMRGAYAAPNLKRMLADPNVLKLFHFARFDLAAMKRYLGVMAAPIYCTRTASKLVRTYTDKHGLKDLVRELLNVDLSKDQQSSDWGAAELTREAAGLCRQRCRVSSPAEGRARCDAGARGPHGTGAGLLRFPAASGRTRPCRLGRMWIFSRISTACKAFRALNGPRERP